MEDRRALARAGVRGGPGGQRDPVGDGEADAEQAGQLVGIGGDAFVGPVAVMLVDPPGEIGQAVRRQQQMQAARDPQRLPRGGRLAGASTGQPGGGERARRIAIDRVEDLGGPVPA